MSSYKTAKDLLNVAPLRTEDPKYIPFYVSKIATMKLDGEIPSSYDITSSVQLLPDRVIDTTNRSTVAMAKLARFDPDGFKSNRPLQKNLFYMDPYITCQWCNLMSFVDVVQVRRMLALPQEVSEELKLPSEGLPPCNRCGKAEHYFVGPHDFSELIANREKVAREKFRRETAASTKVQRAYRRYLRLMYGSAVGKAAFARRRLLNKAALRITAAARGRLARRQAATERLLLIIKDAHPLLLKYALKTPTRSASYFKCFWYDRVVEIEMVFADYLGLCERMGYLPPRMNVEKNIAELVRRITARKSFLLILIQRRWRGYMAQRVVKFFRTERVRLFQLTVTRAMKIQRLYRGHRARLKVPRMRDARKKEALMNSYLEQRETGQDDKYRGFNRERIMLQYVRERSTELTARYTGRVDYAETGSADHGKKMKIFYESCYGDDELKREVGQLVQRDQMARMTLEDKLHDDKARKQFILNRVAEHGPKGYGLRGFKPTAEAKIKNGFRVGPDAESSRSRGMRLYFQQEMHKLMGEVIVRATHDFKIPNLCNRFKEYNAGRAVGRHFDSKTAQTQAHLVQQDHHKHRRSSDSMTSSAADMNNSNNNMSMSTMGMRRLNSTNTQSQQQHTGSSDYFNNTGTASSFSPFASSSNNNNSRDMSHNTNTNKLSKFSSSHSVYGGPDGGAGDVINIDPSDPNFAQALEIFADFTSSAAAVGGGGGGASNKAAVTKSALRMSGAKKPTSSGQQAHSQSSAASPLRSSGMKTLRFLSPSGDNNSEAGADQALTQSNVSNIRNNNNNNNNSSLRPMSKDGSGPTGDNNNSNTFSTTLLEQHHHHQQSQPSLLATVPSAGSITSTASMSFTPSFGLSPHAKNKKDRAQRQAFRREYKFPAGINEDPMAWLDEDISIVVKHKEAQLAKSRQSMSESRKSFSGGQYG